MRQWPADTGQLAALAGMCIPCTIVGTRAHIYTRGSFMDSKTGVYARFMPGYIIILYVHGFVYMTLSEISI